MTDRPVLPDQPQGPHFAPEYCYRGDYDLDKPNEPIPPQTFFGRPLVLAWQSHTDMGDKLWDWICELDEDNVYDPYGEFRDFKHWAQIAWNQAEEIFQYMSLVAVDFCGAELFIEALCIGLKNVMNELAKEPEVRHYLREKVFDALAETQPIGTGEKI